jgi:hypothetical protein
MRQVLIISTILFLSLPVFSQDTIKPFNAIGLSALLPWVNNYSYFDYETNSPAHKSGFIGIGVSAFYKSGINKFSLNFGLTGSLPVPIGPYDYASDSKRSDILSIFMEGLYHRMIKGRFNFISGLNFIEYRYDYINGLDTSVYYSKYDKTMGLTIGSEYRFSRNSSVAILYRPTILNLGQSGYRHLISLELRFDFNFWKF